MRQLISVDARATALAQDRPACGRRPVPMAEHGFSLIEVMVSVLILGVGLLGIAAMQATALKNSQSSLERSQAVVQTYGILDAMRANRDAALSGSYNLGAMQCSLPDGGTLAANDLKEWIHAIKEGFGKADADTTACGQVSCTGVLCTVTVQWDDSRATAVNEGGDQAANEEGGAKRQVTTVVRL